jgi:hypothetical protein
MSLRERQQANQSPPPLPHELKNFLGDPEPPKRPRKKETLNLVDRQALALCLLKLRETTDDTNVVEAYAYWPPEERNRNRLPADMKQINKMAQCLSQVDRGSLSNDTWIKLLTGKPVRPYILDPHLLNFFQFNGLVLTLGDFRITEV